MSHPDQPPSQQLWYVCHMGNIENGYAELLGDEDTHTKKAYNRIFM